MQVQSPYQNPLWPDAVWDVSGAFVNDRELIGFHDYCKLLLGFEVFNIVHGSPLCIWNSGRVLKHMMREAEEVRTAGLEYEKRNIAVYLTFTNLLLTENKDEDIKIILNNFEMLHQKYAQEVENKRSFSTTLQNIRDD
ncbi:MAG: hypothetical protein IIV41_08200, partial [Akkermansia sp.]|nr:hypothetical protein [Akkermansia sp.]